MVQQQKEHSIWHGKVKKWTWLLALFWSAAFVLFHIHLQSVDFQRDFQQKIGQVQNSLYIEEQKTLSLLQSISQQYSGHLVNERNEMKIFSQGLRKNQDYVHAVGLAKLVAAKDQQSFIELRQQLGYQNYQILDNDLFTTQIKRKNPLHFLAVTQIQPKTPLNASFIGQDLFVLPKMQQKLQQNIQQNQPFTMWFEANHDQHPYVMVLNPVYTNEPSSLSLQQKQQQAIGVMFLMVDAQKALLTPIINRLGNSQLQVNFHLSDTQQDFSWRWNNSQASTETAYFWEIFSATILPSQDCSTCTITIQQHLPWSQIDWRKASLFGLLGLLSFLLLSMVILNILSKTQTLTEMHNRLQEILTSSQEAVVITDKNGIIQVWNPAAETLFGYKFSEVVNKSLVQLVFDHQNLNTVFDMSGKLLDLFVASIDKSFVPPKASKIEMQLKTKDQRLILAEISYSVLTVNNEQEISLFIKDITSQRENDREIRQYAYYDSLTQLENRIFFKSQVQQQIEAYPGQPFALMFMDLDGFKHVNDSLGHDIGDELLKVVANRLNHNIRGVGRQSHIARFGGDEFVLMIRNSSEENIGSVALRILDNIERTIQIESHELKVSASIGICFYPEDASDVDTLLRLADTAMYEAKATGKNTFSVYKEEMGKHLSARLQMEKHLRNAINQDELYLVYQPKINLFSGQVIGVEALLRWRNPKLGLVPPNVFIRIAEESRMIIPISEWVIENTIRQLQAWQGTEYQNLSIAVNISSNQFSHEDFIHDLARQLDGANLPRRLLEVELTESTVMTNADENIKRLQLLRHKGFDLAVDDFGTGYSSLSYLKRFPLTILKIDKSFIDGVPNDDEDMSISQAIVQLAHSLDINVFAEGIETHAQLEFLQELGCEFGQGYFISRPLEIADLNKWLQQHGKNFYQSETYLDYLADNDNKD
ncbi:diguanylate cyclase [uncultured Thiomicrorhabdus sp.]